MKNNIYDDDINEMHRPMMLLVRAKKITEVPIIVDFALIIGTYS